MKCIFVIPRMGGGGAERVVSLLANSLAEGGDTVTVLTIVGGESFYPLHPEVRYESVGASISKQNALARTVSKALFFPKALFYILRTLKKERYDVVISMLTECDILVGLCRLLGAKFRHICSERNDPTKRSKASLAILNRVYQKADVFVCQGKRVYNFYHKVPDQVKRIIPNPVDGDTLPQRPQTLTDTVVAVGRLNKQKNFPLLIKSFARVHKEFPQYKLDIYGEGPERATLQELIGQLGMEQKITLCGASKNVKEQIADAELFVMSSDYEGFPNALLEAMAIGLPVVSTDFSTGIASELVEQENGLVVPVNDEDALAEAMKSLLSDRERRMKMGGNNRKKCRAYYTPNIIVQWKSAIEQITK